LSDDYEVKAVASGSAALAAVEEVRPDLVLLDIGLPEMSGPDLARRLRANLSTRTVPIFFMTGRSSAECPEADGVIEKPFTPARLRSAISGHL
jgi:CheY-like chemotaxis protein